MDQIKRKWAQIPDDTKDTLVAAAVAILTFVAGVLATLWTDDIRATFLRPSLRPAEWKLAPNVFWFVVILWIIAFWWQTKKSTRAVRQLQHHADLSAKAAMALPKVEFFNRFSRHVTNIQVTRSASLEDADHAERIHGILQLIVDLASTYDTRPTARYAANVMLYVPSADDGLKRRRAFSSLTTDELRQFLHPQHAREEIQGALYIPRNLSAVANTDPFDLALAENTVFGIPNEYRIKDGTWKVLPGAPLAFLKWMSRIAAPKQAKVDAIEARSMLASLAKSVAQLEKDLASATADTKPTIEKRLNEERMAHSVQEQVTKQYDETQSKMESTALPLELRNAMHCVDDIQDIEKYRVRGGPEFLHRFKIDGEIFQLDGEVAAKITSPQGANVKSFLSLPLVLDDATYQAIGVVNIHCDSPTFIGATEGDVFGRRAVFASVLTPLVFDLARSVRIWDQS